MIALCLSKVNERLPQLSVNGVDLPALLGYADDIKIVTESLPTLKCAIPLLAAELHPLGFEFESML